MPEDFQNISKLFASFAHDLQIGKVMRIDGEAFTRIKPDVAAPLFDFGHVLDDGLIDRGADLFSRASIAILDGKFRLPFPNVWYVTRYTGEMAALIYAQQDDDTGDVEVTCFHRLRSRHWSHNGIIWRVGTFLRETNNVIQATITELKRPRTESQRQIIQTFLDSANTDFQCCTMLLMTSNHTRETLEHHDTASRINARRVKMGKPELPRIIKISLDGPPIFPARTEAGGGGWSVKGHDRRSHQRTLKSGKVITISAMKIKGGAKGQQIYKVDKDKPDDEGE